MNTHTDCACCYCVLIEANVQVCDFKFAKVGTKVLAKAPDSWTHGEQLAQALTYVALTYVEDMKLTKRGKSATSEAKDGTFTLSVECLANKWWKVCFHANRKEDDPN